MYFFFWNAIQCYNTLFMSCTLYNMKYAHGCVLLFCFRWWDSWHLCTHILQNWFNDTCVNGSRALGASDGHHSWSCVLVIRQPVAGWGVVKDWKWPPTITNDTIDTRNRHNNMCIPPSFLLRAYYVHVHLDFPFATTFHRVKCKKLVSNTAMQKSTTPCIFKMTLTRLHNSLGRIYDYPKSTHTEIKVKYHCRNVTLGCIVLNRPTGNWKSPRSS